MKTLPGDIWVILQPWWEIKQCHWFLTKHEADPAAVT